ncbi:MAG: YfhO family protein [Turicibacter sp.]|nr:YfhO family protein [Turicibacter sp.]
MNVTTIKNTAVKVLSNPYILFTILFAIVFTVGYSPFWQNNRGFIWEADGVNTWYPTLHYTGRFFREVIRNILRGDFNVAFFDLRMGFGADILAFGHAPNFGVLHLLKTLVPSRHTEIFLNIFTVTAIYLSGIAFVHFAKYMKQENYASTIGALSYVFSGWVLFHIPRHPTMFSYAMLYLPLMIEGLERTLSGKKPYLLIISVFLMAITSFYWLYMVLLFFVPYVLVRIHYLYPQNYFRNLFSKAGIAVTYTILGMLMGAVIFLPNIFFMLSGSRGGFNVTDAELWLRNSDGYLNIFMNSIAGVSPWSQLLFSSIIIVSIMWLIFDKDKNIARQRKNLLVLTMVTFAIFVVPFGGLMMNGFVYVSGRWMFILAFVLAFVMTVSIPYIYNLKNRLFQCVIVFLGVYGFFALHTPRFRNIYFLFGLAILAIILAILAYVPSVTKSAEKHKILNVFANAINPYYKKIALMLVICSNLAVNAFFFFQDGLGSYSTQFMEIGTTSTEHLQMPLSTPNQDGFFRINTQGFRANTPIIRDYLDITSFISVTNPNILMLLNYWESFYYTSAVSFHIGSWGARTTIDTITSVNYFVSTSPITSQWLALPYGYENHRQMGNLNVFDNRYFLPFGFTYQNVISYEDFSTLSPVAMQEVMLQAVVLEDRASSGTLALDARNVPFEIAEMNNVTHENGILRVTQNNGSITLAFDDVEYSELYVRFTNFTHNTMSATRMTFGSDAGAVRRSATFTSNQFRYLGHNDNYTTNLRFYENPRNTVTITFDNTGTYTLDSIELLALPMHNFVTHTAALREYTLTNLNLHERGLPGLTNRITGEITLPDSRYLFLSIPHSAGWRAYVNGESAPLLRANIAFMALELPAGHHEIELRYRTPGMALGLALTLISTAIFVLLVKFYDKIPLIAKMQASSPEPPETERPPKPNFTFNLGKKFTITINNQKQSQKEEPQ